MENHSSKVVGKEGEDVGVNHFEGVGELEASFVVKPGEDFVPVEEGLFER